LLTRFAQSRVNYLAVTSSSAINLAAHLSQSPPTLPWATFMRRRLACLAQGQRPSCRHVALARYINTEIRDEAVKLAQTEDGVLACFIRTFI
jgi:hypothetical protein